MGSTNKLARATAFLSIVVGGLSGVSFMLYASSRMALFYVWINQWATIALLMAMLMAILVAWLAHKYHRNCEECYGYNLGNCLCVSWALVFGAITALSYSALMVLGLGGVAYVLCLAGANTNGRLKVLGVYAALAVQASLTQYVGVLLMPALPGNRIVSIPLGFVIVPVYALATVPSVKKWLQQL